MNSILNFLKKNWYWVAAAVLLIVVVIVVIRRKKNNNGGDGIEDPENPEMPNGLKDAAYPLRPYELVGSYSYEGGSKGTQILFLQKLINDANAYSEKLVEDGKYGPKTLKAFQTVWNGSISSNGTITKAQYDAIVEKSYIK